MVKRQSYTHLDRYLMEYKMRTPFGTPTQMNRFIPNQQSARTTKRHDAHERSHLKHNPTEAFYHYEGRVEKTPRTKKTHQQQDQIQPTNHYYREIVPPPALPPPPQKSSCCTIL